MKPLLYKSCMVICITGVLSIFLLACNSSRESAKEADSAAVTMPKVDSTSVIPVDTMVTKPDTAHL
ncbi:hypothetical protein [Chitinophaga sp. MM2321]|uniref:hypothetical protein n=1 Tax=Chitinophaga sp. MM2321 TaxID=3137178 RepID=UPI0032D568F0